MNQVPRHDQAITAYKRLPGSLNALLAVGSQRQVADSRVAAIKRPFSFAMADDEAAGYHN